MPFAKRIGVDVPDAFGVPLPAFLDPPLGVFTGDVARDVIVELGPEFTFFFCDSFCVFSRSLAAIDYYEMNK